MQYHRHSSAGDHQENSQQIKFYSSLLERREETWTDLHSQSINEQDESEVLEHCQHILIYLQA